MPDRHGSPSLGDQTKNWPSPNVADSRLSARHTTETGVMHPGTSMTDAVHQWGTPTATMGEKFSGGNRRDDSLHYQTKNWPTPTASENEARNKKRSPSHGESHGRSLAGEATSQWPSPTASNMTGIGGEREGAPNLQTVAAAFHPDPTMTGQESPCTSGQPSPPTRNLNWRFESWLMGWDWVVEELDSIHSTEST